MINPKDAIATISRAFQSLTPPIYRCEILPVVPGDPGKFAFSVVDQIPEPAHDRKDRKGSILPFIQQPLAASTEGSM